MSIDSSAKYYQNKKKAIKKYCEKEVFPKTKKEKSDNMGFNDIKISLKMKNKKCLSKERSI